MAELVNKTRMKSVAWDYFGLEKHGDGRMFNGESAICHLCCKRVLAKHGNTSNLFSLLICLDTVIAKEDSTE